jgi:hypothetical protein
MLSSLFGRKSVPLADCLPGRKEAIVISDVHLITGQPLKPPFAEHLEAVIFAMGCFLGAGGCDLYRSGLRRRCHA